MTNYRFYTQDCDDQNIADLSTSPLYGVVDQKAGGLVAYALTQDMADTIAALLERFQDDLDDDNDCNMPEGDCHGTCHPVLDPAETERQPGTVEYHNNDIGDWCPWSYVTVRADYTDDRCPAGCAGSSVTYEQGNE